MGGYMIARKKANAYERYLKKAMGRYMIASKTQMHVKGI